MKSINRTIDIVLKALPIIGLLPFVILAFFSHPSADDYYFHFTTNLKGWWGSLQSFFLVQDAGRFSSFPFLLFFAKSNWLLEHYWVNALLFLALTGIAFYSLLKAANQFLLESPYSKSTIIWASLALLFVYLNIIQSPAPAFYWLTGTWQNQLAVILICFLLAVLLKNSSAKASVGNDILVAILFIAGSGVNEHTALFIQVCFAWYYLFCFFHQKKIGKKIIVWHLLALAALLTILLMPGTQNRMHFIEKTLSLQAVLAVGSFEFLRSLYHLFSNPVFWLLLVTASGLKWKNTLLTFKLNYILLLFPLASIFLLYIAVCYGLNGRIAARTENGFLFFLSIYLLLLSVYYCRNISIINNQWFKLAAVLVLFSGRNFIHAGSDLPVAYLYDAVMNDRANTIHEAKREKLNSIELKTYEEQKDEILSKQSFFIQRSFQHLPSYPNSIFNNDDLKNVWGTTYAEYYKIDTIKVQGNTFIRWGLDHDY